MGAELAATFPSASETFQRADQLLGIPLSQIAWEGPADTLNDTINTQPALLVHSMAVWRVFTETYPDFTPAYVAGHSMGELSALVAAHALPYEAAVPLVRARGEAMKSAGERSPGGMAAILGLDIPALEQICAQASQEGEAVQVANDNCPGQVVISGAGAALERALELARQAGAKRAVRLAVSIAAHSELMTHAQAQFNRAVEAAPINNPTIPIIGNINARPLTKRDEIRADLLAQLTSRVRWTESIQWLVAQGVTTFIEMGSEAVLTGLLRRIARDAQGLALGSPGDFEKLGVLL
jgi:[acyl-carrier-protein] S-malonyltransferase